MPLLAFLLLGLASDVSSFEELRATLARRPPDGDARIAAFVSRSGGTPVIEADDAIFPARGDPGQPPRLIGDFDGWGEFFPCTSRSCSGS
jgi:hypothetical protein